MKDKERLTKLADRMAVILTYLWAHFGALKPFDDEIFWMSDDANEIRAMPEYQKALETLREML